MSLVWIADGTPLVKFNILPRLERKQNKKKQKERGDTFLLYFPFLASAQNNWFRLHLIFRIIASTVSSCKWVIKGFHQ